MNGCGGESIIVEAETTADEGGYEMLVTTAMRKLSEMLPDCAIHRRREDCGNPAPGMVIAKDEWYIGCAHSGISQGGIKIGGKFTFIRHGSEEAL